MTPEQISGLCVECREKSRALAAGFDPMDSGEWGDLMAPCTTPGCAPSSYIDLDGRHRRQDQQEAS